MTSVDLRRLAIAFACSIAIHEVLIALIPPTHPPGAAREILTHVRIARVSTRPTPTPASTPTPTPPPPTLRVPHTVPAGTHAHVEAIKHAGSRRPTPPKSRIATPIPIVLPTGGSGAGAQRGAGAGSLSNVEGAGNGTGAQGSGNGDALCGAVDFEATGNAVLNPDTGMYERSNIIATVYYENGESERIPLDWTWKWKSEDDDPFNTASSAPMLFQFPPAGQRGGEPAVIQYIIAHTSREGLTRLNGQCPNIPPAPQTHASPGRSPRGARD